MRQRYYILPVKFVGRGIRHSAITDYIECDNIQQAVTWRGPRNPL